MISELSKNEQRIIVEASVAGVLDKKIIVVCLNNETKQRLLKEAREYDAESAIEIQGLRHDIGKQAEAVIIDEETFPFCKRKQGCCDNPLPERLQINVEKKRIYD